MVDTDVDRKAGLQELLMAVARETRRQDVEKWVGNLTRARARADYMDSPRSRKGGSKAAVVAINRMEKHALALYEEIQALRSDAYFALIEEMHGEHDPLFGLFETQGDKLIARLEGDLAELLHSTPGAKLVAAKAQSRKDGPVKRGLAHVADTAHGAYWILSGVRPRRGPAAGDGTEDSAFVRFLEAVYDALGYEAVSATSQARMAIDRWRKMEDSSRIIERMEGGKILHSRTRILP